MVYKVLLGLFFSTALFAESAPIPLLAPEAIEALDTYLEEHPDAVVLEFGSGNSTLWLAQRTRNLYSVEHSQVWFDKISSKAKEMPNIHSFEYFFLGIPYYTFANQFEDEFFDIIIVDGRNRKGCIVYSIPKLKPGGMLMLDDSERKYYHAVYPLMKWWKSDSQRRNPKDSCITKWWIKP